MNIEEYKQIRTAQVAANTESVKLRLLMENALKDAAAKNLIGKVFISEGKEYTFSHLDLNAVALYSINTYGFIKTKSGYAKQATRMYDIKLTPEQILTGVI